MTLQLWEPAELSAEVRASDELLVFIVFHLPYDNLLFVI